MHMVKTPSYPPRPRRAGTLQEIEELRKSKPHITAPRSYDFLEYELRKKYPLREAQDLERFFAAKKYAVCAKLARYILKRKPCEAIRARAHIMMARPEVIQDVYQRREHAESAIFFLGKIVEGVAQSKFPTNRVNELLDVARTLHANACAEIGREDELLNIDDALLDVGITAEKPYVEERHHGPDSLLAAVES